MLHKESAVSSSNMQLPLISPLEKVEMLIVERHIRSIPESGGY